MAASLSWGCKDKRGPNNRHQCTPATQTIYPFVSLVPVGPLIPFDFGCISHMEMFKATFVYFLLFFVLLFNDSYSLP